MNCVACQAQGYTTFHQRFSNPDLFIPLSPELSLMSGLSSHFPPFWSPQVLGEVPTVPCVTQVPSPRASSTNTPQKLCSPGCAQKNAGQRDFLSLICTCGGGRRGQADRRTSYCALGVGPSLCGIQCDLLMGPALVVIKWLSRGQCRAAGSAQGMGWVYPWPCLLVRAR